MNCYTTILADERGALGFERGVLDEFSFLESEYGFRCVSRSATQVRFESDVVFVNVYHGRSSYELGVEVGKLAEDAEARFRLPTIVAALANSDGELQAVFQASTKEAVLSCLAKLGRMVMLYCGGLLHGDEHVFEQVDNVAKSLNRELTEHYAHAALRRRAEAFWREKKYADALRVYEQFGESLTPVEQKKVAFAKRYTG